MGFDITGIGSVADAIGKVIDKIFPDKNVSEQAKIRMAELSQAGELKELDLLLEQIKVNAIEAGSNHWWVAGWRPFIGWVCGSALAYNYVLMPFLVWATSTFGLSTSMPALDMGELMTVLFGILGLGALRTYEKTRK